MDNTPQSSIVRISSPWNLRSMVIDFFWIEDVSSENSEAIWEFCTFLNSSIVFDAKDKGWKYIPFQKGERWSFTFPIFGPLSMPHMLSWWDINIPYLEFDFNAYEEWFLRFTQKIGVDYIDEAQEKRDAMEAIILEVREIIQWDWLMENIDRFNELTKQSELCSNYRSSCLNFLKYLGLDYWMDSEWCTTIPIEYINL